MTIVLNITLISSLVLLTVLALVIQFRVLVPVTSRIIMETFTELREVQKAIVREISAYFFRKDVIENKKTTLRRRKQKGGSQDKG